MFRAKDRLPTPEEALPGRSVATPVEGAHAALGSPLMGSVDDAFRGKSEALFGMGCFWGAERVFWQAPGVFSTAVGYGGGHTPNPTYEEVCSGLTGHAEVVRVIFDPAQIDYNALLRLFWENHDPTQGMRQGNDRGTVYRSCIYTFGSAQERAARESMLAYQQELSARGHDAITTEIGGEQPFYFADAYHQQYLHKNPRGYCGLGGTGVTCPIGI